jgi:uncharacterized membrane protein
VWATQCGASVIRHALRVTPYALIFVAFFVRLNSLAFQSLWRDEVDAIRFALAPLPDVIKTFNQPGFNGPLYFLMLRGWIGVAGQSEFALRFPSLVFGVLGIALIITLGTRLFNRAIGLIAGVLLTFSAYHVWYSQEAKMYTLTTLLALAAIYCLRRGIEDGRARFWIGVAACTSFAMYAHILAALLIPVEVGLFVVWWPLSHKHLNAGLITLALLTVPYLPMAWWQVQLAFTPGETGFSHYTFGEMLSILGAAYTRGILNSLSDDGGAVIAGLGAALAVFGIMTSGMTSRDAGRPTANGARTHLLLTPAPACAPPGLWPGHGVAGSARVTRYSSSIALFAWLSIPILTIFIISLDRPIFTDRYVIWLMPAYYILIAAGLYALWKWQKPVAVVSLALLIIVGTSGIATQATTPYKSDFRSAAQTIAQHIQPDDLIVFQIPYIQYTFDYYYHQPYRSILGPYTNFPGSNAGFRDSEQTVDQQLERAFANRHAVWLIASEMDLWDQRHLLQKWLGAHGTITDQAVFAQVQVIRYELRP